MMWMHLYKVFFYISDTAFWEYGVNVSLKQSPLINCGLDNKWTKHVTIIYSSFNYKAISKNASVSKKDGLGLYLEQTFKRIALVSKVKVSIDSLILQDGPKSKPLPNKQNRIKSY